VSLRVSVYLSIGPQHNPDRDPAILLGHLVESLLLSEWFVPCHLIHLSNLRVQDISFRRAALQRERFRQAVSDPR